MGPRSLRIAAPVLVLLASSPLVLGQVEIRVRRTGADFPPADGDGKKLEEVVEAAAQIWESILQGNRVFGLTYSYSDDLGPPDDPDSLLGEWKQIVEKQHIRFNNQMTWFYDDTPYVNEEFELDATLFRDVDPASVTWIQGFAPPEIELGFSGRAEPGSRAFDKNDLLSVALHEIGHHLAFEHNDHDYDVFPPAFWRPALSIRSDDKSHFPSAFTLMSGRAKGTRVLPAAIESLAIASSDSRLTHVEMPRKYLRSLPFDVPWVGELNWMAGRLPRAQDAVFLTEEARCRLVSLPAIPVQPTTVDRLTIEEGSRLGVELFDVSEMPFKVSATCVVSGGRENPSELAIKSSLDQPHTAFEAGEVLVGAGARLTLDEGRGRIGLLDLKDGHVEGQGHLTLDVLAASGNAEIRARDGDLDIATVRTSTRSSSGRFPTLRAERGSVDLRSPGGGVVDWDLTLDTLSVGHGHHVGLANSGAIVAEDLRMGGGGAALTVGGRLELGVDHPARALLLGESTTSSGSGRVVGKSSLTAFGSEASWTTAGPLEILEGSLDAFSGARLVSHGSSSDPDRIGGGSRSARRSTFTRGRAGRPVCCTSTEVA